MITLMLVIVVFTLIGYFALTAVSNSLRYLRPSRAAKELKSIGNLFFYRNFQRIFFRQKEFDTLLIASFCTKHVLFFSFAAAATVLLTNLPSLSFTNNLAGDYSWVWGWLTLFLTVILSLFIADFTPKALSTRFPYASLKIFAPLASIFLFLCFPLIFFCLKLPSSISKAIIGDTFIKGSSAHATQKIIELLDDVEIRSGLESSDRKLIEAVLNFKDRIVREVMMPRIHVFSLPATTTIRQAAQDLINEGYSRVPVYKDTVDHIIGILMYKDILRIYMQCENQTTLSNQLEATLETLIKPVFYIPETKRASQLLQEFRNKQIHMAVVVDEYGGTEGIVTIEDLLEEIVGEIADEYDDQEEVLFIPQPTGGWIVDSRMSILDIEENFEITIPQDGDYDTLGGYIYHRAGTIPKKGFRIHHDEFELEILSSNERAIEKVKITPSHFKEDQTEKDER